MKETLCDGNTVALYRVQSTGDSAKTSVIFLVLDPATDVGAAVNELRLHNTALLSGLLILVPRCIAHRHLSPDLLIIDKWSDIMRF
jgi:hypothetical protein